jgi:hypothetical protein
MGGGRVIPIGLLAGAATAAAPFVYYWALEWHPLQATGLPYLCLLLCPVVAAGFVAALLVSVRRRWWPGAVLGCVLGAITAGFYFGTGGDVPQELWLQVLLSLGFVALSGVAGAVGGLLGWSLAHLLVRGRTEATRRRVRPWHLGVGVAGVAVVVFGVLAALAGA